MLNDHTDADPARRGVLPPRSVIAGAWERKGNGSIVLDSAGARMLLGRSCEGPVELDAEAFAAIVHEDDQSAVANAVNEAASSPGDLIVGYRAVCPDGERLVVQRGAFSHEEGGVRGAGILMLIDGPDRPGASPVLEMAEACIWLKHAAGRHKGITSREIVLIDMLLVEIGRRLAAAGDLQ